MYLNAIAETNPKSGTIDFSFESNPYIATTPTILKLKNTMANVPCKNCKLKAKYDQNPNSLIGRFWRWHINFCPGWKAYFTSLPPEEKKRLAAQYDFRKYQ